MILFWAVQNWSLPFSFFLLRELKNSKLFIPSHQASIITAIENHFNDYGNPLALSASNEKLNR